MNRFFVHIQNVSNDTIIINEKEDIKHIIKVLRLKENDKIEVSDGVEFEYVGKIKEILKDQIRLDILEKNVFKREPSCIISLYQGIPKQSKMEYIIQKCVELGINNVIPVFTKRTVVHDKGNFTKKVDRWQKIAIEAAKQSKRGIMPQVKSPLPFKDMLLDIKNKDLILFLYENEKDITIKHVLRNQKKAHHIAIIVGPEGGFTDDEVKQAMQSGACPVSIGKTILRTETAAAACLAVVLYELEG